MSAPSSAEIEAARERLNSFVFLFEHSHHERRREVAYDVIVQIIPAIRLLLAEQEAARREGDDSARRPAPTPGAEIADVTLGSLDYEGGGLRWRWARWDGTRYIGVSEAERAMLTEIISLRRMLCEAEANVLAEREACAVIAERRLPVVAYSNNTSRADAEERTADRIAAEIRARTSAGDGDDSARLEEDLETSEREAAKNWQLYWDLYFPLTSKAHYSPAQALASLARTHLDRLQSPDQQPVYGPRAAFAIAAKKGAEIMESLQKARDESDAPRTAPGGASNA